MTQKIDLNPVLKAVDPQEAIAFFRQKGFRIGFDYRDVWQQEHQAAFTVAKAMQIDLLTTIRGFVDDAIAKGTTLETFQKELTPRLQAAGWWGKKEMLDLTTGETKLVQLGSPRRLETIFDTNLATAYSEGQWERIQRNKELFPFLEYVRSASANPRHTHLAYAGLVLRADDPFWPTHMPIKEFGCKCSVIQHTARSLEREGLKEGKAPPEVMRTLVNQRTGEIMQVPTGVDPAFNYPPGGRRANLEKMLADKERATGYGLAAARTKRFADANQNITDAKTLHELGAVSLPSSFKPAAGGPSFAGYGAVLENYAVRHTIRQHGNASIETKRGQLPISADDFGVLPELLADADDAFVDGKNMQGLTAVVFLKEIGGVGYWLVTEARTKKKTLAVVTLRKKNGAWSRPDKQG